MREEMPDTGKKRSLRRVFTCVVLGAFFVLCVMGLGVLRFHSARLAYYLDSLNASIKKYTDQETMLRQELSALIAPVKIYSYCHEKLGMEKVLNAEVLPMYNRTRSYLAANPDNKINNKNNNEKQGWLNYFARLFGK